MGLRKQSSVIEDGPGGASAVATRRPFVSLRPDMPILSIDEGEVRTGKPQTLLVLLLMVSAAGALSFLGSYALSSVLIEAEVLSPWTAGNDPRPRWLVMSFAGLLGFFGALAAVARQVSRSQLRRIDAMAD
jgi:hypothetical protein